MSSRAAQQTELFAEPLQDAAAPEEFVGRIRDELAALLRQARDAGRLPWADYTQSALAELRFDSLSNWLPAAEAAALRAAFARELDRLYAAE